MCRIHVGCVLCSVALGLNKANEMQGTGLCEINDNISVIFHFNLTFKVDMGGFCVLWMHRSAASRSTTEGFPIGSASGRPFYIIQSDRNSFLSPLDWYFDLQNM